MLIIDLIIDLDAHQIQANQKDKMDALKFTHRYTLGQTLDKYNACSSNVVPAQAL